MIGKPKNQIAAAIAATSRRHRIPLTPAQVWLLAGAAADAFVARPRQPEEISWESLLTANQATLLTLVANGVEDNDIAARMLCSPDTVRSSYKRIRERLGTASRIHTVAVALARGLIKPGDIDIPAAVPRIKPGRQPKEAA